jgi:hypothetical protein
MASGDRADGFNRRAFVRTAALYASAFAVDLRSASLQSARANALIVGVVIPGRRDQRLADVLAGVDLGAEESLRSATLFQKRVSAVRGQFDGTTKPAAATNTLVNKGATVIIDIGSDEDCRQIANACVDRHVVFMNAASRSDALRRSMCSSFLHHIEASESMYESAREIAAKAAPAASPGEVVLWHPSLERYGASQLNDRFVAREHRAMTGSAWAGWMAMKVATESFLRAGTNDREKIAAYMNSDATQFDGHKGAALSFRPWDHQLRQPLYYVSTVKGENIARDVPDLARSDKSARELLDALGDNASMSTCKDKVG